MSKYLMKIMYDGTEYHGWQVQENALTVQQKVQDAFESFLGFRPNVTGCSRTDSGVHAKEYCFHFECDSNMSEQSFVKAMNSKLPDDISAFSCNKVDDDFHSRYSVKSKRYEYYFYDGDERNPFYSKFSWLVKNKLDENLLDSAAKKFIGKYDFSGFCSSGSSVSNTVRTVYDAGVRRDGDLVVFYVEADGFLYNMVRIMAGTLYFVSVDKIKTDDIVNIILSKDRNRAGVTAPPYGLFLSKVNY
ncbi:MAG: tRNA pseudouridine(38-40) synthase TruA [Clostridia bacterium]|nr:tRNA pseudouridine(38-40) synthase TruA [Clostridia bacterium]